MSFHQTAKAWRLLLSGELFVIGHMKKSNLSDDSAKKPFIIKTIDFIVNNFLFISLLFLFVTIFKKIFGNSEFAIIAGFVLSVPLASIFFNLINKRFAGFIVFVLFSLPAFALALIFLFM
jgi:hypothetical protein